MSSDGIDSKSINIHQHHSGTGDNLRDKYVYVSMNLAPKEFREPIKKILEYSKEGDLKSAEVSLNTLKSMPCEPESKVLLEIIGIRLNLSNDEQSRSPYSVLLDYLNDISEKDPLVEDLCIATLIKVDANKGKVKDARLSYQNCDSPGEYTRATYLHLVATEDELGSFYNSHRPHLSEHLLEAIFLGAMRLENINIAEKPINELKSKYPSHRTSVLVLYFEHAHLNQELNDTFYWLTSFDQKVLIEQQIQVCKELIGDNPTPSALLLHVAMDLLLYADLNDEFLLNVCQQNLEEITSFYPEDLHSRIKFICAKDIVDQDGLKKELNQCDKDKAYKEVLLKATLEKSTFNYDDFVICYTYGSEQETSDWLEKKGTMDSGSDLSNEFLALFLMAKAFKFSSKEYSKLANSVDSFVDKHRDDLLKLNPVMLLDFAELLIYKNNPICAYKLLSLILPKRSLWVSPLVSCYLNACLGSKQHKSLASALKAIDKSQWNEHVWAIDAYLKHSKGDNSDALESINKAIEINSIHLRHWGLLIHIMKALKVPDLKLLDRLNEIPDEALKTSNPEALNMIVELALLGGFERYEKVLLNWFLESPVQISKFIINSHLSAIKANKAPSTEIDGNIGIRYKVNDKEYTKIITPNANLPESPYIMYSDSPMAKLLSELSTDESKCMGPHNVELLENLPPYVAIFRIAMEIREDINAGNDSFYRFTVSDSPHSILEDITKALSLTQTRSNEELTSTRLPMYMKSKLFREHEPVEGCFQSMAYESKESYQLCSHGIAEVTKFTTDIFGLIYLAISGLCWGISSGVHQLFITTETKNLIENWLTKVNNKDYLTVDLDESGNLCRTNHEEIKASTQSIQVGLKHLLSMSEVTSPELMELPAKILSLEELVDPSVFSTMQLSLSKDIPWLSIDNSFASIFHAESGKIINAQTFLGELSKEIEFENLKQGLHYHAHTLLPYSLNYKTLDLLSKERDLQSIYDLTRIFKKYPYLLNGLENPLEILCKLTVDVLEHEFNEKINLLKRTGFKFANFDDVIKQFFHACCLLSIKIKNDKKTPEIKIAEYIFCLITMLNHNKKLQLTVRRWVSEFMAANFLIPERANKAMSDLLEKTKDFL